MSLKRRDGEALVPRSDESEDANNEPGENTDEPLYQTRLHVHKTE